MQNFGQSNVYNNFDRPVEDHCVPEPVSVPAEVDLVQQGVDGHLFQNDDADDDDDARARPPCEDGEW